MVKTKIICTLGPSSGSEKVLRKMILYGMDVARLNFSHGSDFEHLAYLKTVRDLNKKLRRRIRILQDLEGYRIRIGSLRTPLELEKHQVYSLAQRSEADFGDRFIPFDYQGDLSSIKKESLISEQIIHWYYR